MKSNSLLRFLPITILFFSGIQLKAQRQIKCPSGEVHLKIEFEKMALTYQAQTFETTLSGLRGLISGKASVDQRTLQAAYEATQQWNELLKGLVAGYNSCAISEQQYQDGLKRIYPRLQQDASDLEEIRQILVKRQQADLRYLQQILQSYFENMRRFAEASDNTMVEAIRAAVEHVLGAQKEDFEKLEELVKQQTNEIKTFVAHMPKPAAVQTEIENELRERSNEAEHEYNEAYDLLQKYQFRDAIPHLRKAFADVPLPAFGVALGIALKQVSDMREAENVIRVSLARKNLKPEYEFALNQLLAAILLERGDFNGAEQYARRALATAENAHAPDGVVALVNVSLGTSLLMENRYSDAEPVLRHALELVEDALGKDPAVNSEEQNAELASALMGMSFMLHRKGDYAQAKQMQQRVVALTEREWPDSPFLAEILRALADEFRVDGNYAAAQSYYERALKIQKAIFGKDHLEVAFTLNSYGLLLQSTGDYAAAERIEREALAMREKALGPDDPNVGISLNNIAGILRDLKDRAGAEKLYRRAIVIQEKTPNLHLATTLDNLAQIVPDAEAESLYRRSLEIEEKLAPDTPELAHTLSDYAGVLAENGEVNQAEQLYQRALAIDEKRGDPNHPGVASNLLGLARIFQLKGKQAEAEELVQRALRIDEKAGYSTAVAKDLKSLAALMEEKHDYSEAEHLYRRALSIQEKASGSASAHVAETLNDLAQFLTNRGRDREAKPLFLRLKDILIKFNRALVAADEQRLGPSDPKVAQDLTELARLLVAGKLLDPKSDSKASEEAEALCRRAIAINEKTISNALAATAPMMILADVLTAQGKYREAEEFGRRALAIAEDSTHANDAEAQGVAAGALFLLGGLMEKKQNHAESEKFLRRSLSIVESAAKPDDPALVTFLLALAVVMEDKKNYAEAAQLYDRALTITEKTFGAEDPRSTELRKALAEAKERLDKKDRK